MHIIARCLMAALLVPVTGSGQGSPLVVINANLADAVKGAIGRGAVVIRDGRIGEIVFGAYTPPAGALVIDARGRYLLPGLIDVHTHIASLSSARRALESGVTTVRSASVPAFQDVALREAVKRGAVPGPDMVATGVFVSPDLGETILADPRLSALAGGVTSEAALRELVRINADRGVDFIKTRGTERAGLPNTDPRKQTYTETQLGWIVDEATRRNIPVMAHAHGDEGAYAAVKAGVRSIEHGTWLSDSTLRLMKEKGTFFVPTWITILDLGQPGGDYDDPILTLRGRFMAPVIADAVRKAHRMGVKVATGADTDYGPSSLSRIAAEVGLFVEAGMTPLEALRAATSTAADLLRVGDRVGQLAVGFEADLILVEGNPLSDVRALSDVLVVISNGRVALNRTPFGR
jgi:imidazolonepropionase-like amidohydrolase